MTGLGASGATAGALMPPLNLILMPLLQESGQLGLNGDLIVAIDDQPIENENDLLDHIDGLKPGDTVYFTVVRTGQKGSQETLKIPVELGKPEQAVANASATQDGPPVRAPAVSQPKSH
jgi:S1-C subfamily serine protease